MIKNNFRIFLILMLFITSCSVTRNQTQYSDVPTWQENFDQTDSINKQFWSRIPRGRSDWNNYMSEDEACYDIREGKLILRGIINPDLSKDTARFLTGGIYTRGKKSFGYGRIEIRAKFQNAQGAWPAFWLLPEDARWPNGGEIDIMERLNDDAKVYQTVHSPYTLKLGIKENPLSHVTAPINQNEFNTYAVERYPDSLVFYVNDQKTLTYPKIDTDKPGQFPFDQHTFYLLIDMQLGGNWVGKVDAEDLPVKMEIDWVKFYRLK